MKIHEYQAKAILARYGVTTPRSEVAFTKEEAREAAQRLKSNIVVVKAQIQLTQRQRDAQDRTLERGDSVQRPAGRVARDQLVELRLVVLGGVGERLREPVRVSGQRLIERPAEQVRTMLVGNLLMVHHFMTGCMDRGLHRAVPTMLLTPVYWALMSVAAYKALAQLARPSRRHYWELTRHGLVPDLASVDS